MSTFLYTEKIHLRELKLEDARHFASLLGGDREAIYRTATLPFPCTEETAVEWIKANVKAGGVLYAMLRSEDAEFVGCIGMCRSGRLASLGYWVGRTYWGRGYATDAIRCAIDLARQQGVAQLEAETFLNNPVSERVLSKNGFVEKTLIERELPVRGGSHKLRLHVLMIARGGPGKPAKDSL